MAPPLRVAVSSVSSLFASLLSRGLALHAEVSVIHTGVITQKLPERWTDSRNPDHAPDGPDGPDVIVLDFDVDRNDDLLAATEIRSRARSPILVLAPHVTPENTIRMQARGFPVVRRRPDLNQLTHADRVDPLYQLLRATIRGDTAAVRFTPQRRPPESAPPKPIALETPADILLVIGASTGGPPAVRRVLQEIPPDRSWAIAVVQHITPSFAAGFAQWVDESTHHRARLAEHQMPISAGTVVIAPGDTHLLVRNGTYILDHGEKRLFQRPSADNLFESAAAGFGSRTVGILLTGMGRDGAAGCCAIARAGGFTIAQNQESCAVYGMPRAAVELGCASKELPLEKIGNAVTQELTRKERKLQVG